MRPNDLDLHAQDIQLLSDLNGIASFFEALDYKTNRLTQNLDALGIKNATLRGNVRQIEQLVAYEAELVIYFVELKSVTVASTQALAREFKNSDAEFMFVLTDDYNRIDFVLLERLRSESGKASLSVRPRVLTVDRRDPGPQALRVLRRFTFTEPDPFAQYDKLLSAYTVAEWSAIYYNNRALFSDYYLNERLRDSDEWKGAASQIVKTFRATQPYLVGVRKKIGGKGETAAFESLYRPLLSLMGFRADPGKQGTDHLTEPDFRLYAGDAETSSALMLAYAWNRNLDTTDSARDANYPDEVPGTKVVTLLDTGEADWAIVTNGKLWRLYSAKAHSRATNYYEIDLEEALSGESTLDGQDRGMAFLYWWLFFRADAFIAREAVRDGKPVSLSFLARVMADSEDYAKALGERLKNRVFEDIFPHFAQGLIIGLKLAAADDSPVVRGYTEDDLNLVFHATLTLLYRLMFLLYAEARNLLPIQEARGYYEISLKKLKEEVAESGGSISDEAVTKLRRHYSTTDSTLYTRLQTLFAIIDQGNAAYNMPQYNGGLFITRPDDIAAMPDGIEKQAAQFLLDVKVPDQYIALGLDFLARDLDLKTKSLVAIDFKSLGVRQLGSIYEGLLEFKLAVATQKMAVVMVDKVEKIVPYAEAKKQNLRIKTIPHSYYGEHFYAARGEHPGEIVYAVGQVYLINTKQERKATGSYYTPDYIVNYIVEHTVGPVLDEKLKALTPRLREAGKKYAEAKKRAEGFVKSGMKPDDPEKVWNDLDMRQLADDIFDLKVLDPAMGSGHFLVKVVDYVSDRIIKFLDGHPTNPLKARHRALRESILDNLAAQNISVDRSQLTDVALLKRQVLKRCVYGVDLNPMAVELAKVSLWLDAFTLGAPLSFLDHHLKCGNSLIGARRQEAEDAISKHEATLWSSGSFTGLSLAADEIREISASPDATIEESRHSKTTYQSASAILTPMKRILDVYMSRWFGNAPQKGKGKNAKQTDFAIEFLRDNGVIPWLSDEKAPLPDNSLLDWKKIAKIALTAAKDKRFFHWELEFPEVFFAPGTVGAPGQTRQDAGFDAVIGNPPYFSISQLKDIDKGFLGSRYKEIFTGNSDILYYFLTLGETLPSNSGALGFIVARYFQDAKYALPLRKYLAQKTLVFRSVDFQNFQVFGAEVNVLSLLIFLAPKSEQVREFVSLRLSDDHLPESAIREALATENPSIFEFSNESTVQEDGSPWYFKGRFGNLDSKLALNRIPLGAIATVVQSMQTGRNSVLAPSRATLEKYQIERSLLHPLAKSGSVLRFELEELEESLIWTEGINLRDYPNAQKYLTQFRDDLSQRYDIQNRGAKWWEISNPRSADLFFGSSPRILVPFVATGNKFCVDEERHLNDGGDLRAIFFNNGSGYSEYFVCGVLNSTLLNGYHLRHTKLKRGGYYEYFEGQLSKLPIPRIAFSSPADRRNQLAAKGHKLYERCLKEGHACVLEFVDHHMVAGETDVIHDLLAFLAQQMTDLNKQKQSEMKRFLGWFEAAIKIRPSGNKSGWDVLTGKTDILEYLGDYQKGEPEKTFKQIQDRLIQNQTKLAVNVNDQDLNKRLQTEYEKSLAVLKPIKAQLATTDALIDQVVYRLYGLTEDEIKIVEGRG